MEDFWRERRVFVTGGTGFIGSWIVRTLVEQDANVVVLVRDDVTEANNCLELFDGVSERVTAKVRGDLVDYDVVLRCLNEYEIEYCFHLAAQTIVTTANRNPLSTFESNIKGTWNLLEAARSISTLKGVIVASSDKAYGVHQNLPYTEESPLLPRYPYDTSKACADMLTRCYYHTYGVRTAVIRCANVYGPVDLNFSRIVPDTMRAVLFNREPLIRSDGSPVRDYLYVKDAVKGYLMVGENLDKLGGEAFNLGAGSPLTVLDLVNKIIKLSGKKLKPRILGKGVPEGEIDKQYLSAETAEKLIGWKRQYTLEEGLKETIQGYRQYFRTQAELDKRRRAATESGLQDRR